MTDSQYSYSYLAQVETGQKLSSGLFESEHGICLIDAELGLAALASGPAEHSTSPLKSVQILQDDMHTNLTQISVQEGLLESFTNIHEYLQNTNEFSDDHGIGLVALHAGEGEINVISSGGFQCLRVHQGQVSNLLKGDTGFLQLGCRRAPALEQTHCEMVAGDLVVLISHADALRVGDDFMRLTLSRFANTPDVIVRQINTRLSNRMQRKTPSMLCLRCESVLAHKQGWLGQLFER
jgi:hypothetical protein